MQCFCIKGSFDFHLRVIDPQTIIYTDLSEWMTEAPHVIPDTYEVMLRLPNSSTYTLNVKALSSTSIKASDLGLSKFKDGIYCFSLEPLSEKSGACGIAYTKSIGVFPNLTCCLDNAYSTLEDDKFDSLKEVESWLKRAQFSSELGKEKQSLSEWGVSKKLLEKLNCNCSC